MDQAEFTSDKPLCDLVMKGGIASDVVFPLAIVELAKKYRLSRIGGTSSGALAAAIAAAAEYARDRGGYLRLAQIPTETMAKGLLYQFQPDPALRPLFEIFTAPMSKTSLIGKSLACIGAAMRGYPGASLAGFSPLLLAIVFVLISMQAGWLASGLPVYGWLISGALLAVILTAIFLAANVAQSLNEELPKANYGLCSGKTLKNVDPRTEPAITDWLAQKIDWVAGHTAADGRPLTFGDLKSRTYPTQLAMVTTDLNTGRPYRLPFRDAEHFFSKAEFSNFFPDRVIEHMCRGKAPRPVEPGSNCPTDLYPFPVEHDLPIVVAARMSLSFPFIIQQVPLYKADRTLDNAGNRLHRCLFSDGGITNNFPIGLFDRLWPNNPTFGICFDEFLAERHATQGSEDRRIEMTSFDSPEGATPILPIGDVSTFVSRLLGAATNWQDNLQSSLTGYRERIIRVHLKPGEGDLNLKMSRDTIKELTNIGEQVKTLVTGRGFDEKEYRWRRFLIAMAQVEQMLDDLVTAYKEEPLPSETFSAFLARHDFRGKYQPVDAVWKTEVLNRANELVAIGERWRQGPTIRSGKIPKPECGMRIEPEQ